MLYSYELKKLPASEEIRTGQKRSRLLNATFCLYFSNFMRYSPVKPAAFNIAPH